MSLLGAKTKQCEGNAPTDPVFKQSPSTHPAYLTVPMGVYDTACQYQSSNQNLPSLSCAKMSNLSIVLSTFTFFQHKKGFHMPRNTAKHGWLNQC